ncbi:MAG: hypothetical protein JOZ54_21865 [Acidobacteria bacterium]|nr:hypothetical protein [Acidobacteriota bacterium]
MKYGRGGRRPPISPTSWRWPTKGLKASTATLAKPQRMTDRLIAMALATLKM